MSKINWYVGMPVCIVGYIDCKVYSIGTDSNDYKPIEIQCKLKNGELRYLDCTLDGRTCADMVEQNVFFEPVEIPESAKRPKRWRAEKGGAFYFVSPVGSVISSKESLGKVNLYYKTGNYFRTREEAEAMAEKIRAVLNDR